MNDALKARMAETEGASDGLWEVKISPRRADGEAKYFPSVVLGFKPGMRYPDGSGSDEDMKRNGSLIINSVAGGAPMAEHEANAHLIALAPELKTEVLRQDTLIGELVEALESLSATVDLDLSAKTKLINLPTRLTLEMIDANDNAREVLAKNKEQS